MSTDDILLDEAMSSIINIIQESSSSEEAIILIMESEYNISIEEAEKITEQYFKK